ncbi:hypothetical protein HN873_051133, partial [Arachis hypogaea]
EKVWKDKQEALNELGMARIGKKNEGTDFMGCEHVVREKDKKKEMLHGKRERECVWITTARWVINGWNT